MKMSISGLLESWSSVRGSAAGMTDSVRELGFEAVRDAMLSALQAAIPVGRSPLEHRIRFAGDVQALWFLRSDLMAVLSSVEGEARAHAVLAALTTLFDGLLPDSLVSRPSPLGNA